jgi:CBS domain-containing protein
MLVRDVMTSPAVTAHPDLPLKRVAQLLDEHAVTALPVVDDGGRIVGVISEADVVLEALPRDPRAHANPHHLGRSPHFARAADVMNHHPITVRPDTDLVEATELMTSRTIKSLPVVHDGVVVGVVSRHDVVAVLAREDQAIEAELDDLVRNLGNDWLVRVKNGVVTADGPADERERELMRTVAATVPGVVAVRFA